MNLKNILLLLKLKLFIILNGFIKGALKKRIRKIFALVGGGFLFFFLYKWIFDIFISLSTVTIIGRNLIDNFIIVSFLGFFLFLMVSGITVSIHYLFISSDLPLLMTSPLSNNTIFMFKLIEAMFANSSLFFFMGIPIFIVYGLITHAQWYYYPLMILNALCFLAIPISIAFLGALLIVRIIPPQRARDFMAILLGIVSLGIWLVLQIVRASIFDKSSQDFNPGSVVSLQQISQKFLFNLLPSTWAARALTGFANSDLKLIIFNLLPLMLFVACIFTISIQLSKYAFRHGFISSDQALTLRRRKKVQRSGIFDLISVSSFFSSVPGSIFIRDLKLLFRDTRQLTNILLLAIMMVILPLLQKPEKFDSEFLTYYPYLFLIFFGAIVTGQISSRLIPLEGKSFWITRLIPQSSYKIIFGKFLLGFSFSTILSWTAIAIISIYFHHPLHIAILAMTATICFSMALSSLGVLIGMNFSRFDWEHPKRMLSPAGVFILSISVLLIGGIVILIYVIGNQLQFSLKFLNFFASSAVFLISFTIMIIANWAAAKKFEKMEWEF